MKSMVSSLSGGVFTGSQSFIRTGEEEHDFLTETFKRPLPVLLAIECYQSLDWRSLPFKDEIVGLFFDII